MLPSELAPLPEGKFAGLETFQQWIRVAITAAQQQGWNEMVWSDASFEDWPLREKAVVEALHGWAQRGRKLTLLAHRFDSMQRLHPRFVDWRIRWDHIVDCRVCKATDASEFPSVLWSPTWSMQRMEMVRSTGFAGTEAQRRLRLGEMLDELYRHSSPGFAASVLGL